MSKQRAKNPLDGISEIRDYAATSPEIGHRVHLGQCVQFVTMYVERARDLAKDGQKDQARDWLRFFRNSRILEILTHEKAGDPEQVQELKKNLIALNSECHPLDVPDYSTDLQALRGICEQILKKVSGEPQLEVVEHPEQKEKP